MDANTRMAYNTGVLYIQLIITIIVNLFSTRLILNAMGVEDYGIVNLIAGIVAMLSFVQNSMAISSQRYMSVCMGKNDEKLMIKTFNTSFKLHLIFAIGLLVALIAIEPLIFNSAIQIPLGRVESTKILYYLTILGTLLVVIAVPFDATINAHEDMVAFSVIAIIDSMIRLAGAIYLLYYSHDKLIYYGLLIVTIRLAVLVLKWQYSKRKYIESRNIFLRHSEWGLMKEMFSFAFWNMFGALAITGRNQGVAVILNTFWGVRINASYGISNQVGGQMSNFASMISKAMNPQIMKNAGAMNNDRVMKLSLLQCKVTSLLMCWFVIPLFMVLPFVLRLWLQVVPDYCVVFCRYFLALNLITQMSSGLMSAVQSSGKVMAYQVILSIIVLINLPLGYTVLRMGYPPQSVLACMIFVELICVVFRALYTQRVFKYETVHYFIRVFFPVLGAFLLSIVFSYAVIKFAIGDVSKPNGVILGLLVSFVITSLMTTAALSKKERSYLTAIILKIKSRIRR